MTYFLKNLAWTITVYRLRKHANLWPDVAWVLKEGSPCDASEAWHGVGCWVLVKSWVALSASMSPSEKNIWLYFCNAACARDEWPSPVTVSCSNSSNTTLHCYTESCCKTFKTHDQKFRVQSLQRRRSSWYVTFEMFEFPVPLPVALVSFRPCSKPVHLYCKDICWNFDMNNSRADFDIQGSNEDKHL